MTVLISLIFSFLLIIISVFLTVYFINKRRKRIIDNLETKLFLLQFPREDKEGTNLISEINKTEQIFSNLSKFNKPVVFEISVSHVGSEICFYASVPASLSEAFIRQMQGIWSDVLIEEIDDYNVFHYDGTTVGGYLSLKEKFVIPIRTYIDVESDTFQSVLGGLSKIDDVGEGGVVQIIIKPAGSSKKSKVKSVLKDLKNGKSLSGAGNSKSLIFEIGEKILGKETKKEEINNREIDQNLIDIVHSKIKKPLFEINVRVIASAPSTFKAESIYDGISSGFSQFASPEKNDLSLRKVKNIKNFAHDFSFRNFDNDKKLILNSEELASIFHFPTPFTKTPKIKYLKSKQLPVPSVIPNSGILLGENIFQGKRKNIYILDKDRRRHLYVIGQTGTGKTNFVTSLINQDIQNGKGVAFLDPHGDAIDHILGLIPKERYKDVILFDPTSIQRPMGLNMLEYDFSKPEQKTFIVNEMVGILDKLYDLKSTGGPMFEQYMRNALLLLMEDAPNEPATLMEIPRIFSNAEYRNKKLNRINNATVINFWREQAEKAGGDAALQNVTPYITSKFNNFIANDYMRVIIGQTKSSFNFRETMDKGKILLVNLSKGKLGELNANLLGMIIVGKITLAAFGRADMDENKRCDFNLYIDEFQNFTTDSISTILSEARKYRLSLIVAHQFIAQLPEKIRDSIFGNVGSLLSFRVSATDAEFLSKQFKPEVIERDLINVDNFNMYVKLLINGETTSPFNVHTFPTPGPNISSRNELKSILEEKYGRPREEVENEITKRLTS
jgi:hypothetical protein